MGTRPPIDASPPPSPDLPLQVVVRCRPLFGKEINEGRNVIVDLDPKV
jgi:hypothetical protein